MAIKKPAIPPGCGQKPRVLILGPLPPPYMGPSVATDIIIQSSLNRYFIIDHLDTNTHSTLESLGSIKFRRIMANFVICCRMISLIIKRRPDLVLIPICQTTMGFLRDSMFIIISALLGRRTLLQLRGSNFLNWLNSASGLTKVYVAKVLRQARGVIVLGDSLKYQFSSFFSKDKIFAVPNGADFKTPASIEKVKSAGVLKLLCLSNLQPSKGVEDVIQGVLILKRFHGESKVELNIVGSWRGDTTKNTCTNLVKEFDLPVFFQSSTAGEEKFAYYLKADIFVFTPREPEGHPWVIVEAMAAGLPIITTDQGAITEAVFDGVNGFIVGMQKPEQIAHKIRILAEDIPLRKKMGRASRRLYEECFTETKMVQNLRECFCEIING